MPSDKEMMDWLACECFLPGDRPSTGVYAVVAETHAPLGAFNGDTDHDTLSFRAAVAKAMAEH